MSYLKLTDSPTCNFDTHTHADKVIYLDIQIAVTYIILFQYEKNHGYFMIIKLK